MMTCPRCGHKFDAGQYDMSKPDGVASLAAAKQITAAQTLYGTQYNCQACGSGWHVPEIPRVAEAAAYFADEDT